jgi:hypothetical protein
MCSVQAGCEVILTEFRRTACEMSPAVIPKAAVIFFWGTIVLQVQRLAASGLSKEAVISTNLFIGDEGVNYVNRHG